MNESRRKKVDAARQQRQRERDAERGVKTVTLRVPIEFHDALKRLSAALRDDFPVHDALADAFGPSEAAEREFERLRDLLENTRESERSAQDQIVGVTLEADELRKDLKETSKALGAAEAELGQLRKQVEQYPALVAELKDANEKLANWNHWRDTLDDLSLWDRLMGRW